MTRAHVVCTMQSTHLNNPPQAVSCTVYFSRHRGLTRKAYSRTSRQPDNREATWLNGHSPLHEALSKSWCLVRFLCLPFRLHRAPQAARSWSRARPATVIFNLATLIVRSCKRAQYTAMLAEQERGPATLHNHQSIWARDGRKRGSREIRPDDRVAAL